ncbi:MAG: glycosyltransferase family 4 protein [Desulfobacteraceae bacterium]|nr:glycosyltransferase family 4 protein [Desulfobacteraceae bacterium]
MNGLHHKIDSAAHALQEQHQQLNLDGEGRHRQAVRILDRAIHEHDLLLADQAYTLYPGLHAAMLPSFQAAVGKISGPAHPEIQQSAPLLFLEIAKEYQKIPGGIWRLNAEIAAFLTTRHQPSTQGTAIEPATPKTDGEPLRLLVLSGMFPSIEHGGGLRLFDIIDILADLGHQIDLFSIYVPERDQASLGLLQGKLAHIRLVPLEEFTAAHLQAWLTELGRGPRDYHAVQGEYPQSARLLAAARPFARKTGFTFMEYATKSLLTKLSHSLAEYDFITLSQQAQTFWELTVLELTAASESDFLIAVTTEDAAEIERITGQRPEVIPTCLSPSQVIRPLKSCRERPPEGETVVFLGYFDHFPNIDGVRWYLNKVHPLIKKQVPSYRFLVVGAGDTSQLREQANGDPSVVFTGRVDDIASQIVRGKVCVLPLVSGAGIRGKLNQYALAGRPSVSTSLGNLGLNFPPGQAVLIADRPEDFAREVVRLLTGPELNRNVAERAREHALANFTWEPQIERLLSLYRA